jgi:hypothetical protein
MALTREDQLRIMREDRMRRHLREQAEADAFVQAHTPAPRSARGTVINRELVRGIGVISPPLRVRVTEDCWSRGMRGKTIGVAPGTELTASAPSVAVTRNGETSIVPASSFRKPRNVRERRKPTQATQVADTARVSHGHNFAAE